MLSKNPFNTGSPARGAGFLGRQSIIHNILSFLEKKTQFNLLLFGQRRIGKTSLLRKLQDDPGLRERAFPVYFNLQDKASIELHRLLFEIAGRIISDLGLKIELNIENFTQDNASFHFQNDFIPLVTGRLPDRKQLLLLFDEFDVLDAVEDVEDDPSIATFASKQFIRFTANLIEDIQAKKYPIKFIFAIGRNYKDLEPKRFGQIMKFGPQEELSYFSKEETRELLKASDNSIPFDAEAVDEIYSLTFGHPYFAQCLASVSFDAAEKNHADFVTRDIVRDRLIASIKSYSSGIYWIWDSLSPTDKLILYIMAALKEENQPATMDTIREKAASLEITPAVEELKPTIEKLQNFKFVNDHHGQYDFYVEFIRKWIAGEVSGSEIAKLLDKVDEDIGFHLNNARYFFKKKDYKQAIQHYDEILKKSPYHFEALFYMAKCYKNLKDADTKYLDYAIDFYKKSYEINRHKVKQEYLSLLHEKWDELSEKGNDIEEIFKEIQRIEPGDARITEKLVAINSLQKTLSEINPETPNKKEKLDMLRRLNESRLRIEVLIPLFEKMGFKDVIEYHGSVEKGKDIIFYEMDKFDNKIYTGVVVKAGDITGST
ncbi:MAG: hypothetical protein QG657_4550, partial [Acidobacteriota bacterium]|nr:hypothetical protein [Acidobacteriota bacterium]